ncbi:hypothetical protein VN12_05585 [Pirellula sp. SH-Sr6A]|nr:hypothetical protein VN12_05585 [Pirellula sp. SH-Sr6A]
MLPVRKRHGELEWLEMLQLTRQLRGKQRFVCSDSFQTVETGIRKHDVRRRGLRNRKRLGRHSGDIYRRLGTSLSRF